MGRVDLQLPETEFWHLTFREVYAMLSRRRSESDRADLRAGLVAASVLNSVRSSKDAHFFEASDFFPNLPHYEAPEPEPSDVFASWVDALKDLGLKPARRQIVVPSPPPRLPVAALPDLAAIEAKLASLAP